MDEEEKKAQSAEELEDLDDGSLSATRRQFLIGAGAGILAGAAGAAGVIAIAKPGAAPPAQPVAPSTSGTATALAGLVDGARVITLNVNGKDYQLAAQPQTTLFEVLKRDLGLTGVKLGCNGSMCSACSVLVDGVAMNSCSLLAMREQGKKITTIEGLEQDGKLHPVQVAFWENQGYQCGFCTPGQILGAVELLNKVKNPTEEQIRIAMSGHMCKCSAYPNIIKSVQAAAKAMA